MSTVFDDMTGSESKGAKDSQPNELIGKARPARLCYVDDSRTSAYVVKRMLKPYGYVVDHFESAEPALFALIQEAYDLLLTDLKVSPKGMDGDDLVRTLRASGHVKIANLPVIVITGATDSDILAKVYEAGANQIMTKPVNGVELDAHIRKLVFEHKNGAGQETGATDNASVNNNVVPFAHEPRLRLGQDNIPTLSAAPLKPEIKEKTVPKAPPLDPALAARRVIRPNIPSAPHPSLDSQLAPGRGNIQTTGVPTPRPNSIVKPAPKVKPAVNSALNISLPKNETRLVDNIPELKHIKEEPTKPSPKVHLSPDKPASAGSAKESVLAKQAALRRIQAQKQKLAAIAKAKAIAAAKKSAATAAAAKAQPSVTPAQPSGTQSQPGKVKKPIDPRVLAKIKAAAAAKKAKLAQQQKAKTVASVPPALDKLERKVTSKDVLMESADHLSLAPKDGEPIAFATPKPTTATNIASPQAGVAPAATRTKPAAAAQPQQTKTTAPAGASAAFQPHAAASASAAHSRTAATPPHQEPMGAARQAAKEDMRPKDSVHASSFFDSHNDKSDSLFDDMDRYPLVQTHYREEGIATKVITAVNSVVELYGPKKVAMVVVMLLALFIFYNWMGGIFDDGVAVDVTTVEQGEIFQSITVPGKVVSKLRVDITPSIAGRLTNVYVEEGDTVKKEELLARLDDREAKSNVKRAETNLENAHQDVSLAERSLKRLQQAYEKGAVAHQLVEEAEVELRSARARESVAEEEVRTAKLSLENPRIVAPFSGTVTARYVEVGQWVVPSETLFTLVDQSQREIEVQVDAADSGGIAVGQTVTLSSDAFPGLNWTESVTRLAAATSNVGNANTVSVYISLGSSAPSLRFGQQVDAEIRTAWNPSALKVPYGAIINRNGKTFVAVIQQDSVRLVEVETGIEDFSHVEIRQGVSVGQTVILANGLNLEQGDHVYIATR